MISLKVANRSLRFGDHYSFCPNCTGAAYYKYGLGICYDCGHRYRVISAAPVHLKKFYVALTTVAVVALLTGLRKR